MQLKPLPAPLQAANGAFGELKSFRYPHSLDPKHLSIARFGDQQLMPSCAWNLLISKEILQFNVAGHSDRVKSVTRTPMADHHQRAYFVSIEKLAVRRHFWSLGPLFGLDSPLESGPIQNQFPLAAAQRQSP